MSARDGKRLAIFGKSGSGKTELAFQKLQGENRLFVFDPKGSWAKEKGFEVLTDFRQVKPFLDDMGDGAFRVVYMPEAMQAPKRLSTLCMMLLDFQKDYFWEKGGKKMTLAVDELQDAFPVSLPAGVPGFAEVCQKGREYGINVVGITQRPAAVSTHFRGNLDMIASFNFSFPTDRKAVAEAMEDFAIIEAVQNLDPYHFVWWEGQDWQVRPPISLS